MAKKAKITKLKEDQILQNGSKDTLFPVTLGEAVQVKQPNTTARETLASRLNSINSTLSSLNTSVSGINTSLASIDSKLELQGTMLASLTSGKVGYLWYTYKNGEGEDTKVYYEILGFRNIEEYGNWASVYNRTESLQERAAADALYIITRTISGEVTYDDTPPDPEDPPIVEIPRLITPTNGSSYTVTEDNSNYTTDKIEGHFNLSGEYLKQNLRISSDRGKFKFAIRNSEGMSHMSILIFTNNINLVNASGGVDISVIPADKDNSAEDTIRITSDDLSEPRIISFEYVKQQEETNPEILKPVNIPITINLDNIKGTHGMFQLKMANAVSDAVVEVTNNEFYLSKNQKTWSSKLFFTSTDLNNGVLVYVTCYTYSGGIPTFVPQISVGFNINLYDITITSTDSTTGLPDVWDYTEGGFSANLAAINYTYTAPTPEDESYLQGVDTTELVLNELGSDVVTLQYKNLSEPITIQFNGWGNNNNAQGVNWERAFNISIKYDGDLTYASLNSYSFTPLANKERVYVKFALKPDVLDTIPAEVGEIRGNVYFQSGNDQVECYIIWRRLDYEPGEEDQPILVLKREDNPVLVDQLYNLSISGKYARDYVGVIASNQGLTQDELDSVIALPEDFCRGITASSDRIPFDKLDLTLFTNLTKIESTAFAECYSLEEVIFPPNLATVGSNVLGGCIGLVKFVIPSINGALNYICNGCTNLEYVEFGEGVPAIASGFEYCDNITTIVLRRSVETTITSGGDTTTVYVGTQLLARMGLGLPNRIAFSTAIQGENSNVLTIYVPTDAISWYGDTSGNWYTYFPNATLDEIDNLPTSEED